MEDKNTNQDTPEMTDAEFEAYMAQMENDLGNDSDDKATNDTPSDDKPSEEPPKEDEPKEGEGDKEPDVPNFKLTEEDSNKIVELFSNGVIVGDKKFKPKTVEELISVVDKAKTALDEVEAYKEDNAMFYSFVNNGITSKEDINRLIASAKGEKAAILSLVKEHGITAEDLENSESSEYDKEDTKYLMDSAMAAKAAVFRRVSAKEPAKHKEATDVFTTDFNVEAQNRLFDNVSNYLEMFKDFTSGRYDEVMEELSRKSSLGLFVKGATDYDKYQTIRKEMVSGTEQKKAEATDTAKESYTKASPAPQEEDTSNMTDKEFEEWCARQEKMGRKLT